MAEDISKKLRKHRRNQTKKALKKVIVDAGDMPIYIYVVFSAIWITVSSALYTWSNSYSIWYEAIEEGAGSYVIYGFVVYSLIIFILVMTFGFGSIWCFQYHRKLIEKGAKKKKGYLGEIIEEINTDLNKKKGDK